MTRITLTLIDLPHGRGVLVCTDGAGLELGQALTPAQQLARGLIRTARLQAKEVRISHDAVPLVQLAHDLLHPEQLGYAVTPEVRDRARLALGRQPTETRQPADTYGEYF